MPNLSYGSRVGGVFPRLLSGLRFGHTAHCSDKPIRVKRDPINSLLDQEGGEVRVIGGCLAADAHGAVGSMGAADHVGDHAADGFVPFVKQVAQFGIVAIDPEHELGQVVRANKEAVEPLGESLGENHVGGDLAHHHKFEARTRRV